MACNNNYLDVVKNDAKEEKKENKFKYKHYDKHFDRKLNNLDVRYLLLRQIVLVFSSTKTMFQWL